MKKPILLQINTTLNSSSTGRIAEQIALFAESKGWNCYIAHGGRYVGKSSVSTYQISSKIDNTTHALKSIVFGLHGLGSTRSTIKFVEWIKKLNPDIIHLHNIHGYFLNYQILFEYLSNTDIPIVWTLHDCWAMTGQCTHFVEVGCEKWKTGCHDCELLNYAYKTFFDRSDKNWNLKNKMFNQIKNMTIVPVSKWLDVVVKESLLKKYPRQMIYNGIDLSIFKPSGLTRKDLGLDERFTLLGVSSGWGISKGLSEFVELSKQKEYQVVMVGVQNELIAELPSNIKMIRKTQNQTMLASYYSLADVFINPSHADSFPTVNLEALACGTPVITYRTGGSPEAVDDRTGAVVERGDFKALCRKIIEFKNTGFKQQHSCDCRRHVETLFDKNLCMMKYIELYQELLNR